MNLPDSLLAIIVCPQCRGALEVAAEDLVCRACRLAYPVVDDIPVLLVDEALEVPQVPEAPEAQR